MCYSTKSCKNNINILSFPMQTPKVNLTLLHKLLQNNKETIRKALELFVETTIEDMKDLNERIYQEKFFEASRMAHTLKSRFVYLGNDDAFSLVKKLEVLLKDTTASTSKEIKILFNDLSKIVEFCLEEVKIEIQALRD